MPLFQFNSFSPKIHPSVFIAPGAQLIGNVIFDVNSSCWFNAVLRAEHEEIRVGKNSNIQDGAVCHVDPGFPLIIGDNVTVGHKAMLHGATIGDGSLIGINAVVLNGAKIGKGCIVGANALVTEGMEVPDGSMVMGTPAKIVKNISKDQQQALLRSAQTYFEKAKVYQSSLEKLE